MKSIRKFVKTSKFWHNDYEGKYIGDVDFYRYHGKTGMSLVGLIDIVEMYKTCQRLDQGGPIAEH
jgi:hypothetical protein